MKRRRAPGNIEQRGDTFRVRLSVGGQRYRFTIPSSDRRVAEDFARRKYRELEDTLRRKAAGFDTGVLVSSLLSTFVDQEIPRLAPGARTAYAESIKPIRQYFIDELGDPTVDSVQAKHVVAYLSWRRVHRLDGDRPLSNRTLAKDRAVLHRIFSLAVRSEMRDGNPVARTEAPKCDTHNPVIITQAEYERLIHACEARPMLQLYVVVLGEGGLRANSEALQLRWEDVDLENGFLWVSSGRDGHRTKSGRGRWVPMTPRLLTAMRDHFARYRLAMYKGKRAAAVFHHDHDHHLCRAGERVHSFYGGFKAAAKRAKLSKAFRQHDLRHRRVTTWLADGKNAVHVKEAMGHSDLRTTMGYTHLAREHLKSLVEPGHVGGHEASKERATGER